MFPALRASCPSLVALACLLAAPGCYFSKLKADSAAARDCEAREALYRDADGDGYGDALDVVFACGAEDGYVAMGGDCDDANADQTTICLDTAGGPQDDTGPADTGPTDTGGADSGPDTGTADTGTPPPRPSPAAGARRHGARRPVQRRSIDKGAPGRPVSEPPSAEPCLADPRPGERVEPC